MADTLSPARVELLAAYSRALRVVADGLDDTAKAAETTAVSAGRTGLADEQRAAIAGDLLAARRARDGQKRKGADWHFYRGAVNALERVVNDLSDADRDAITAAVAQAEGKRQGFQLVAP